MVQAHCILYYSLKFRNLKTQSKSTTQIVLLFFNNIRVTIFLIVPIQNTMFRYHILRLESPSKIIEYNP